MHVKSVLRNSLQLLNIMGQWTSYLVGGGHHHRRRHKGLLVKESLPISLVPEHQQLNKVCGNEPI